MKLRELLAGAERRRDRRGWGRSEIAGLAYDSRRVEPGDALLLRSAGSARTATTSPRRRSRRGAAALVVERRLELPRAAGHGRRRAGGDGPDRGALLRRPDGELRVAGITGTNGKTTTAFLIRHVLEAQGIQTGLLGTVKRVVGGVEEEVERTTPEAIDLQATFRRMLDAGDAACAMEVSSHALALERHGRRPLRGRRVHQPHPGPPRLPRATWRTTSRPSAGCSCPAAGSQATPASPWSTSTIPTAPGSPPSCREAGEPPLMTFSPSRRRASADFRALDVSFDASGSRFRCVGPGGEVEVRTPLPGHFNVENALAAIAACHALGVAARRRGRGPGRRGPGPGALRAGRRRASRSRSWSTTRTRPTRSTTCSRAARRLTEGQADLRLRLRRRPRPRQAAADGRDRRAARRPSRRHLRQPALRGPGGDHRRDPRRHPGMRAAARARGSRSSPTGARRSRSRSPRPAPGDTVVIAGKGHEQGQEFEGGRKIPFDDREVAREELRGEAAGRTR